MATEGDIGNVRRNTINIFTPHRSPVKNAQCLDDVRLRKMVLETAQILCTVLNVKAGHQITTYKNSHVGNRVTLWAMKPRNWIYLWSLGMELSKEYHFRFGKAHASMLVISEAAVLAPEAWFVSKKKVKKFVNAARNEKLKLDFTYMEDSHRAYRTYMKKRWKTDGRPPTWTRRGPPKWR